ncbi:hypothetical protein QR680_006893 [Steinernema hermaphroditum]|uniref:Uncharacterized protein n=1 Tax=Steinernema hermaphroditum TaxID=289476 RepID=A0AA39HYG3_9BILA|nr:hypothetical protein QR680_006893 [Steinernema hermaphroditum]
MADNEANVEIFVDPRDICTNAGVGGPRKGAKTGNAVGKAEDVTQDAGTDYETLADEMALKAVKQRCADEHNFKISSKKLEHAAYALIGAAIVILLGFLLIFFAQLLHSTAQKAAIREFDSCLHSTKWSPWTECDGSTSMRESKRCGLVRRIDCACPPTSTCRDHSKLRIMSVSDWKLDEGSREMRFHGVSGFYNATDFVDSVCKVFPKR